MCDEEYRKHLRSLNPSQYEFFTHIMHVAATKDKQETCCLHGGAGTGKSHVLKSLVSRFVLHTMHRSWTEQR